MKPEVLIAYKSMVTGLVYLAAYSARYNGGKNHRKRILVVGEKLPTTYHFFLPCSPFIFSCGPVSFRSLLGIWEIKTEINHGKTIVRANKNIQKNTRYGPIKPHHRRRERLESQDQNKPATPKHLINRILRLPPFIRASNYLLDMRFIEIYWINKVWHDRWSIRSKQR